jgi:dTMP kinase
VSKDQAPFIPSSPDADPVPAAPWRVFGTRSYFRLWIAQVISSTGDWIGLIAILAIAARVSDNSGAAVSLVMLARVVPGFFLGTIGGVLIDRLDRRLVMVCSDIGRAALLVLLPFVETLAALVLVSFLLEIFTLLWGPAKDASVPHLVSNEQLSSANTLSLVASYGTFPFASIVFSLLAAASTSCGASRWTRSPWRCSWTRAPFSSPPSSCSGSRSPGGPAPVTRGCGCPRPHGTSGRGWPTSVGSPGSGG